MKANGWLPLALSEQVTAEKPLAAFCEGEAVALFRDTAGRALALEDRCPHRRVPLSLGHVKDGQLQCGYHGWIFDGVTGFCSVIPNLRPDERLPSRTGARPFPIAEGNGFVQIWLGQGIPLDVLPTAGYEPQGVEFTGSTIVGMAEGEYHGAILDGIQQLIAFDEIVVTDFFLGDCHLEGDSLVLDRGAYWAVDKAGNFLSDYPLVVRTRLPVSGGVVTIELLTVGEEPICTVVLATVANRRGTTGVCWRGYRHEATVFDAPDAWHAGRSDGRPPFQIIDRIDAAAVAALLPIPSRELVRARAERQRAPALVAV